MQDELLELIRFVLAVILLPIFVLMVFIDMFTELPFIRRIPIIMKYKSWFRKWIFGSNV